MFLRAFVHDSHLFGVRLWSTGLWTFLEDDFWMFSVSSSCWFNTGYMLRQFKEAFLVSTAENCGVPQLQFFMVVDISCRGAEADSHGLVQQTIVIPQLQFLEMVIVGPVVRVAQFLPGRSQRQMIVVQTASKLRIPAVAVHQGRRQFPVVVQRPIPMARMTMETPQLRVDTGGRFPLLQVVQFPVVTQRLVPWSRLFVGPQGFPSSSLTR